MELRQLEHFVAVAEELHFGRAAARMHIVQSGLSASIRALERELGADLLIRTTRRVELSEAGRALLPEARGVLAAARSARDAVAAVQGVVRGTLSIGIMQMQAPLDLAALLSRFRRRHPGVEVRLRQGAAAALVQQVRDGELDLAFTAVAGGEPPGIDLQPLGAEDMLLACPRDHRVAGRRSVRLADLRDEDFLDFPGDWAIRAQTDRAFADAGIQRRIAFELNEVRTLVSLVAAGLGIAIVPPWVETYGIPVALIPLAAAAPRWELSVATRAGSRPSPAARALLALLPEVT